MSLICYKSWKPAVSWMCGALAALIAAELLLRPFFRDTRPLTGESGAVASGQGESRSFLEGFAVCEWGPHGSRGISTPWAGARPVMIVGDSFVEARQVGNNEMLATLVERNLRAESLSNHVFSLGYKGASLADQVRDAERYKQLFDPSWTVVVLDRSDFEDAMVKSSTSFFERDAATGNLVLKRKPRAKALKQASLAGRVYYGVLQHSSLCRLAWIRASEFLKAWRNEPPMFQAPVQHAPLASDLVEPPPVRELLLQLKQSYSGRLTLLYRSPEMSPPLPILADAVDAEVEKAAGEFDISFVSMAPMYRLALSKQQMPTGFRNTQPFVGHWNAVGHAMASEALTPELLRMHRKHGLF